MSVKELESAVANLSREELSQFSRWFEEFQADAWDEQIERDVESGRFDRVFKEVDEEFETGRCKPL